MNVNADTSIDLVEVLNSDSYDLVELYNWFYIPKRNAEYLKRNAIIALGNNPDQNTSSFLEKIYPKSSSHLKIYIIWALFKIGNNDVCQNLIYSYDSEEGSIKEEYEKLKKMISLAK